MLVAAELLGFDEYIPPYSTAKGKEILKGVNYASGAAGIRCETGQHLVSHFMKHRIFVLFYIFIILIAYKILIFVM